MLLHGNNLKINDPYNRIHDNLIYPVKSDAISTPRDHLPPDPTLPKPRVVLYHSTPPPTPCTPQQRRAERNKDRCYTGKLNQM